MKLGKYHLGIKRKGELILPLLFLVFTLLYFRETHHLLSSDAMLLVRFILLGVLLLSGILIARQITFSTAGSSGGRGEETPAPFSDHTKKIAWFIVLTTLSLLLLRYVGYVITFVVYSILMMYILGVRDKKWLVFVPLVLLSFLYFLFQIWLTVPLPKGFLG